MTLINETKLYYPHQVRSDELKQPKKRGRPTGTGGKYKQNPNQIHRGGRKRHYKTDDELLEQVKNRQQKQRENALIHYYKKREIVLLERQKKEELENKLSLIIETVKQNIDLNLPIDDILKQLNLNESFLQVKKNM